MYTMIDIEKLCGSPDIYRKGQQLYHSGAVLDLRDKNTGDDTVISARIRGESRPFFPVTIRYSKAENRITQYSCNCAESNREKTMCAHCAAAAQKYMWDRRELSRGESLLEQWQEHEHMTASERAAHELASRKEKHRREARRMQTDDRLLQAIKVQTRADRMERFEPAGDVEIIPVLTLCKTKEGEDHYILASFKIGQVGARSYILRNLAAFAEAVEREQYVTYGKQLAFVHSKRVFTKEGWDYVSLIRYGVRCGLDSGGQREGAPRDLEMTPELFERFAGMNEGRTVECYGDENVRFFGKSLHFLLENAPLCYVIRENRRGGYRLEVPAATLYHGSEHLFVRVDGTMYRCEADYAVSMKAALELSKELPEVYDIAPFDMPAFCGTMAAALERNGCLQCDSKILEQFRPKEATFTSYVEEEDGKILWTGFVKYGEEQEIPVLKPFDDTDLFRDEIKEQEMEELAGKYFPKKRKKEMQLWFDASEEERMYQLLSHGLKQLQQAGEVYVTDRIRSRRVVRSAGPKVGVSLQGNLLELSLGTDEFTKEELKEALSGYRSRKKFCRLKNGDYLSLEDGDMRSVAEVLDGLDVTPKDLDQEVITVPSYRFGYVDRTFRDVERPLRIEGNTAYYRAVSRLNNVGQNEYAVPQLLTASLRKYQREGYQWMRTLADLGFGGILADDMGLGKTLQTIAYLSGRIEDQRAASPAESAADAAGAFGGAGGGGGKAEEPYEGPEMELEYELFGTSELAGISEPYEGTTFAEIFEFMEEDQDMTVGSGLQNHRDGNQDFLTQIDEMERLRRLWKGSSTSLIICPASLVYNWQREFQRFAPEIRVLLILGDAEERARQIRIAQAYDVVITSYDLLRRDLKQYEGIHFQTEVLDEAQNIKNHGTQTARAVKCIDAQSRFALTGTPIENRLSELWSIFDYLMPGILGSYEYFRKHYEKPIVLEQDEGKLSRLKRMVTPFILRRLKKDVLKDLPGKQEQVIYAEMNTEQRKIYAAHVARMKESLEGQSEEAFRKGKLEILSELTKLREICCEPGLLYENYAEESCKVTTCIQLAEDAVAADHRVLIFSQFTSVFPYLEKKLAQKNISYFVLTGQTSREERMRLVDAFHHGEADVFLISLKAGGTGLNLTAADIVIHFDPWWNLAARNQATDRAHRIGQTSEVTEFSIIAQNTIEERILELQEKKHRLAGQILGGEGISVGTLTREDFAAILS